MNSVLGFTLWLLRHCDYWTVLQASIELTDEGEFIIHNEGRRPLFISGKAVTSGQSLKLSHNQTLEVSSCERLLFSLIYSLSFSLLLSLTHTHSLPLYVSLDHPFSFCYL